MAVAHYLEALDLQKEIVKVHTIFGGKNPHPNWLVGGVPCAINIDDTGAVGAINMERLNLVKSIIDRTIEFIDRSTSPTCWPSPPSTRAGCTAAACRRRTCCPTATSRTRPTTTAAGNLLLPRGAIIGGDLDKVHEVDLRTRSRSRNSSPLLVQVRRRIQGPAPLRRRHRAQLRAGPQLQGHAHQHRADRRVGQVLLDQGAALARPRHGSRPAGALHHGLRAAQATPSSRNHRHGAEEARRAGHRAVLHPGPHRGARLETPTAPTTRCASSTS
jgi:hypothetical protein